MKTFFKIVTLSTLVISTLSAEICEVTSSADSGFATLRYCLENAYEGDTVTFNLLYPATINILSPLVRSSALGSITIAGPGADNLTILADDTYVYSSSNDHLFTFESGTVTLQDLTINGPQYFPVGRSIKSDAVLNILRCKITNHVNSTTKGGGILASTDVNITDSNISNHKATSGGGIHISDGALLIESSNFTTNLASGQGGGIYADVNTSVTIKNSTFNGNKSGYGNAGEGGSMYLLSNSWITIENSQIINSQSNKGSGGGIYRTFHAVQGSYEDRLSIYNSHFQNNKSYSGNGGAIFVSTNFILYDSNITANGVYHATGDTTDCYGGGLYMANYDGYNSLQRCNITSNVAVGHGGGIYGIEDFEIFDSLIASNTSEGDGGGIYFENPGTVTLRNSTISSNAADGSGGGIAMYASGSDRAISLQYCSVASNTCDADMSGLGIGGGIWADGTQPRLVYLRGTLIAQNVTGFHNATDLYADCSSLGHNLVGLNGGSGITDGLNNDQAGVPGDLIDPILGPLQNNGGPTMTHALLAGSPAIDKAEVSSMVTSTDQRGVTRINKGNAYDIGAYESDETASNAISPALIMYLLN